MLIEILKEFNKDFGGFVMVLHIKKEKMYKLSNIKTSIMQKYQNVKFVFGILVNGFFDKNGLQ